MKIKQNSTLFSSLLKAKVKLIVIPFKLIKKVLSFSKVNKVSLLLTIA